MNEKMKVLKADLEADELQINKIYRELMTYERPLSDRDIQRGFDKIKTIS